MLNKRLKESIRFKFFSVISLVLVVGSMIISAVIAFNEREMLKHSLMSKGRSLASYIAKLSTDPLIMKDNIQLDSLVNEANKDEDIMYTLIENAQGEIVTSQFASINIRSPRLNDILSGLPKESELKDIVAAIKKKDAVTELTTPIVTGADTIGKVTICISKRIIRQQMIKTILFISVLNMALAFVLGAVLFVVSKKILLTPISELAGAAARLAKGDLSGQVTVKTTGEVQMLVDSFNQMARDLEKTTVSRDYVDNIIKSMTDSLIVASPDGAIRTANQAACTLLGYPSDELTGQSIKKIFAADRNGDAAFDELIKFGLMKNVEFAYMTRDGRRIPILFSSSVIYSDDAAPQWIVCIGIDITERKRIEEKLQRYASEIEQANEELKTFTYTVSHDLRAPLVNIQGFSEEFKRTIQDGREFLRKYVPALSEEDKKTYATIFEHDINEAVGFIGASVSRMDFLIESILKLSRLGRSELKPALIETGQLVHSLLKTLAHQVESHQAQVRVHPLPDLVIDRTAIERIFGNLLDNALKYLETSRPGRIEISAEQNAEEVTFAIRDNGRGIVPDDIKKVFDPFRRVGKQDVPGEGMGLSYVKTLVKRLGGRIWCESELGVGTTFSFTVPAKPISPEKNAS